MEGMVETNRNTQPMGMVTGKVTVMKLHGAAAGLRAAGKKTLGEGKDINRAGKVFLNSPLFTLNLKGKRNDLVNHAFSSFHGIEDTGNERRLRNITTFVGPSFAEWNTFRTDTVEMTGIFKGLATCRIDDSVAMCLGSMVGAAPYPANQTVRDALDNKRLGTDRYDAAEGYFYTAKPLLASLHIQDVYSTIVPTSMGSLGAPVHSGPAHDLSLVALHPSNHDKAQALSIEQESAARIQALVNNAVLSNLLLLHHHGAISFNPGNLASIANRSITNYSQAQSAGMNNNAHMSPDDRAAFKWLITQYGYPTFEIAKGVALPANKPSLFAQQALAFALDPFALTFTKEGGKVHNIHKLIEQLKDTTLEEQVVGVMKQQSGLLAGVTSTLFAEELQQLVAKCAKGCGTGGQADLVF